MSAAASDLVRGMLTGEGFSSWSATAAAAISGGQFVAQVTEAGSDTMVAACGGSPKLTFKSFSSSTSAAARIAPLAPAGALCGSGAILAAVLEATERGEGIGDKESDPKGDNGNRGDGISVAPVSKPDLHIESDPEGDNGNRGDDLSLGSSAKPAGSSGDGSDAASKSIGTVLFGKPWSESDNRGDNPVGGDSASLKRGDSPDDTRSTGVEAGEGPEISKGLLGRPVKSFGGSRGEIRGPTPARQLTFGGKRGDNADAIRL